jgi:hypothetical protein
MVEELDVRSVGRWQRRPGQRRDDGARPGFAHLLLRGRSREGEMWYIGIVHRNLGETAQDSAGRCLE